MSAELRFDPLSRRHVILAPGRARRGAPTYEPEVPDAEPCDFCGGQEDRTPPETYAIREPETAPDGPGWGVRVVPNLYPATRVHEVVVHTPDHHARLEDLHKSHRTDVLRAYRDRARSAEVEAAFITYNRGRAAGASRSHDHGQLFGLEIVPPTLEREARAFADDSCVLCGMADEKPLAISAEGGWSVIAHPAPLVADEVLVVPPCTASFESLSDEQLPPAAVVLADAVRRLESALGPELPFNLIVHTAPRPTTTFHWHIHVMPRTARWAGLELGAELPIVAANPYETARKLRSL